MTKLGQAVTYIGVNGKAKAAFVIGTEQSIAADTSVPALETDQVHLVVFSPTGNVYTRYNVAPVTEEQTTGYVA